MEIINTGNYKLCGIDEEYRITSYYSGIGYKLIDSDGDTVELAPIPANTEYKVVLQSEGKYTLEIHYNNNEGVTVIDYFTLRYYKTLKEKIVTWMKAMVCDCTMLDNDTLNCTNTATLPVAQDLYDAQLLFSSTGLYRDYLLSPDFLRPYQCCFTATLDGNGTTLESLLDEAYQSISNDGVTPNTTRLLRLYTAYLYILFYTIETDAAVCDTGTGVVPPPPDPDETRSQSGIVTDEEFDHTEIIQARFDIDNVKPCMREMGIDFDSVYATFESCYTDKVPGLCQVYEDATRPPEPVDATIADLTYTNHVSLVEIGTTVSPTTFSWTVTGTPSNLRLDDGGDGNIVHQSVSGTSYNTAETYTFNARKIVRWILSGDNVNPIALSTMWLLPIYTGKTTSAGFPDATTITTTGTKHIVDGGTSFSHIPDTSDIEYGWIAVPVESSTSPYDIWEVLTSSYNNGSIGVEGETGWDNEFIGVSSSLVSIGGENYYVYMYNYPSEVDTTLTVSRDPNIYVP